MSENGITRVQYFDRQFLRRQDFSDEQAYHLAMRRRHNISHHVWGIVTGLSLIPEEENIFVQPGMAIDGYGRELILQERRPLPLSLFDAKDTDMLDVWLLYDLVGSDPAQSGYVNTTIPNPNSYYRWQEYPRFLLTKSDPDVTDRRHPEEVPEGDVDFAAYRSIPDNPEKTWPVYLGQITRKREGEPAIVTYNVNLADRPYIGLVGEGVTAPSGLASVQIGNEKGDSSTRFAVHIPAKSKTTQPAWLELQEKESGDVSIDIRGDTTFHGNIHVVNGGIELGLGAPRTTSSESWRIYRHLKEQEVPNSIPQGENGNEKQKLLVHQLRLEMARGRQKGKNQVVIGTWSADEKQFMPCVTIDDRQTMTVHGDLLVKGRVIEPNARPMANMNTDARTLTQTAALSGMSGASQVLTGVYQSPFSSDKRVLTDLLETDDGRQQVVDAVLETNERSGPFLTLLLAQQQGVAATGLVLSNDGARLEALLTNLLSGTTTRDRVVAFVIANQIDSIISIVTTQHTSVIISSLLTTKSEQLVNRVVSASPNEIVNRLLQSPPSNFVARVVQDLTASILDELSSNHTDDLVTRLAEDSEMLNKLLDQKMATILSTIASDSQALEKLITENVADVIAVFATNDEVMSQLISEQATAVFVTITSDDELMSQFVAAEPDKIIAAVAANRDVLTSLVNEHRGDVVSAVAADEDALNLLINDHAADLVPSVIANQTELVSDSMWDDQNNLKTLMESLSEEDSRVESFIERLNDDQFAALKNTLAEALKSNNGAGTP